jgi:hypothetical protein
MRLYEFVETDNAQKLVALSQFLSGRADDETATKQISQTAFIDLAKSLGVNVNDQNIGAMIDSAPLNNLLEPFDPSSGVVRFKGNTEAVTGMSVDQAQEVVNSNAKSAMKRRS